MARRERVKWMQVQGITLVERFVDLCNTRLIRLERLLTGIIARVNTGTTDYERTRLNFVDTASATWTITDDAANDELKVQVTALGGGGGAPTTATYITQTPDAGLSAEQAMSLLATGLVKNTTATGVLSIAVAGTDYAAATHTHAATTVEVNLGATAKFAGRFTITDAAIGAGSKVLCWQAPGPYTGKGTRADEAAMQPVSVIGVEPAVGSAQVQWQTPPMVVDVPLLATEAKLGGGTSANNGTNRDYRVTAQRLGKVRGNVKFTYWVMS